MSRTPEQLLEILRGHGAGRLERVRLRANRRTIWSLTGGGRTLNLHRAYSRAPDPVLAALAVICREALRRTEAYRRAARTVADWSGVRRDIRELRAEDHQARKAGKRRSWCCATPDQRGYLRALFRELNRERFDGRLPDDIPLRLSSRMRRRLGQMRPGPEVDGRRTVGEIALNVDLLLPANDALRLDTMLHEMAHAADYLESGHLGHGPSWKGWARKVGCRPRACAAGSPVRRSRRDQRVTAVPTLEGVRPTDAPAPSDPRRVRGS